MGADAGMKNSDRGRPEIVAANDFRYVLRFTWLLLPFVYRMYT